MEFATSRIEREAAINYAVVELVIARGRPPTWNSRAGVARSWQAFTGLRPQLNVLDDAGDLRAGSAVWIAFQESYGLRACALLARSK
ncbi:MAG: hypothetical protein E5X77_36115 [Mesorhizobium sp.]|nr:MAG: hypothetical protein E5X77_36115 [Mesorhizobium sp.]